MNNMKNNNKLFKRECSENVIITRYIIIIHTVILITDCSTTFSELFKFF